MKIEGIEVPNVFPASSESNGDGYEIRVAKYIDGIKKTMQTTFYNKNHLKGFALLTEIKRLKENLVNKIAVGEAKSKEPRPRKFREISAEYLESKSGKARSYYLGRARIVRELDEVFGNKYFGQIKQSELEQYVKAQNSRTYGEHIAMAKDNLAKEKIHQAELEYGVKKLNAEKSISLTVIQNAHKGENIAYTSAIKLCNALNLNFAELFDDFIDEKFYSEETLESVAETIYGIFERARLDKQITENPISDYDLYGQIEGMPPKEKEILSDEEQKRFLAQLNKLPINEAMPFEIMTNTGIRSCEVEGLSWSDISFEDNAVNVRYNRQCKERKKRKLRLRSKTKTKAAVRTIPMTVRLRRKLIEYKAFWEEMKEGDENFLKSDAIYCDFHGNPKRKERLNLALERILFDADCKVVTCHCLRHRWITELIDGGMNPADVQILAGHESITTTMGYYHKRSKEKIAQKFLEVLKDVV